MAYARTRAVCGGHVSDLYSWFLVT